MLARCMRRVRIAVYKHIRVDGGGCPDADTLATEQLSSMHESLKPRSSPPPALSRRQFAGVVLLVRITATLLPTGYWDRRSQVLFRFASSSARKSRILLCIVPDLVFTYIHTYTESLSSQMAYALTPLTIKRLFANKSLLLCHFS